MLLSGSKAKPTATRGKEQPTKTPFVSTFQNTVLYLVKVFIAIRCFQIRHNQLTHPRILRTAFVTKNGKGSKLTTDIGNLEKQPSNSPSRKTRGRFPKMPIVPILPFLLNATNLSPF